MAQLPAFIWIVQFLGATGFGVTLCLVCYRGAVRQGAPPLRALAAAAGIGAGFVVVVLVTSLMARALLFRQEPGEAVPWLAIQLLLVLAATLLIVRGPARRAGPAALVIPQAWRVLGGVFLIVMAMGDLPPLFALPAGIGDVLVGLSAPWIARRLARGDRRGAVAFNALGILDLVNAVTLGLLTAPGPLRIIDVTPPSAVLNVLPLVLIPTVLVPICIGLHIESLRRLRAARTEPAVRAGLPSYAG